MSGKLIDELLRENEGKHHAEIFAELANASDFPRDKVSPLLSFCTSRINKKGTPNDGMIATLTARLLSLHQHQLKARELDAGSSALLALVQRRPWCTQCFRACETAISVIYRSLDSQAIHALARLCVTTLSSRSSAGHATTGDNNGSDSDSDSSDHWTLLYRFLGILSCPAYSASGDFLQRITSGSWCSLWPCVVSDCVSADRRLRLQCRKFCFTCLPRLHPDASRPKSINLANHNGHFLCARAVFGNGADERESCPFAKLEQMCKAGNENGESFEIWMLFVRLSGSVIWDLPSHDATIEKWHQSVSSPLLRALDLLKLPGFSPLCRPMLCGYALSPIEVLIESLAAYDYAAVHVQYNTVRSTLVALAKQERSNEDVLYAAITNVWKCLLKQVLCKSTTEKDADQHFQVSFKNVYVRAFMKGCTKGNLNAITSLLSDLVLPKVQLNSESFKFLARKVVHPAIAKHELDVRPFVSQMLENAVKFDKRRIKDAKSCLEIWIECVNRWCLMCTPKVVLWILQCTALIPIEVLCDSKLAKAVSAVEDFSPLGDGKPIAIVDTKGQESFSLEPYVLPWCQMTLWLTFCLRRSPSVDTWRTKIVDAYCGMLEKLFEYSESQVVFSSIVTLAEGLHPKYPILGNLSLPSARMETSLLFVVKLSDAIESYVKKNSTYSAATRKEHDIRSLILALYRPVQLLAALGGRPDQTVSHRVLDATHNSFSQLLRTVHKGWLRSWSSRDRTGNRNWITESLSHAVLNGVTNLLPKNDGDLSNYQQLISFLSAVVVPSLIRCTEFDLEDLPREVLQLISVTLELVPHLSHPATANNNPETSFALLGPLLKSKKIRSDHLPELLASLTSSVCVWFRLKENHSEDLVCNVVAQVFTCVKNRGQFAHSDRPPMGFHNQMLDAVSALLVESISYPALREEANQFWIETFGTVGELHFSSELQTVMQDVLGKTLVPEEQAEAAVAAEEEKALSLSLCPSDDEEEPDAFPSHLDMKQPYHPYSSGPEVVEELSLNVFEEPPSPSAKKRKLGGAGGGGKEDQHQKEGRQRGHIDQGQEDDDDRSAASEGNAFRAGADSPSSSSSSLASATQPVASPSSSPVRPSATRTLLDIQPRLQAELDSLGNTEWHQMKPNLLELMDVIVQQLRKRSKKH